MPCPYKMRGTNFTLCTPQVVCIGFSYCYSGLRCEFLLFRSHLRQYIPAYFQRGDLSSRRILSDVYCIFPFVAGCKAYPNNAYLIGRAGVCYFSRHDLPKFFPLVSCPLLVRKPVFSPMRVLLLGGWRPLFVALRFVGLLCKPLQRPPGIARVALLPFRMCAVKVPARGLSVSLPACPFLNVCGYFRTCICSGRGNRILNMI